MGLGSFLSGLPIVGEVFGGLTGTAQAKSQSAVAGLQANVSKAQIQSRERIFEKGLELDREKFAFLKEQAKITPTSQTGSYGYPYVAVKQYKAAPLVTMPILLVGGGSAFLFCPEKEVNHGYGKSMG